MKTLVVINPKSGGCRPGKIEKLIRGFLCHHELTICRTMYCGHAEALARSGVSEDFDTIVVVGGDGTVNEVLNGIIGSGIKLAIIPAGTANDLVAYYDIPNDVGGALDIIKTGRIRKLDAIKVNQRYYLTVGGIGLAAGVVEIINRIRRKAYISGKIVSYLGSAIYIVGLIGVLLNKSAYSRNVSIDTGGRLTVNTTNSLLIGQQPRMGKYFNVFPGISGNSGRAKLQLITDRDKGLLFLMNILSAIHVINRSSPCVKKMSFSKAVITLDRQVRFFGDGEILDESDRFIIEIIPKAVNLIVPAGKEGDVC
jgi:diacylglycerol kinase (ATP)